MSRLILAIVILAPLALAYALTAIMFGSLTPSGGSYDGASDGYVKVLVSYSIMFCIATWIGGGFTWLTIKLAKARVE
jgi:hypothetical protein